MKTQKTSNDIKVKDVLLKETDLGSIIIEQSILKLKLANHCKLSEIEDKTLELLVEELISKEWMIDQSKEDLPQGYIILQSQKLAQDKKRQKKKNKKGGKEEEQPTEAVVVEEVLVEETEDSSNKMVLYEDFIPYLYEQFATYKYIEFKTFDECVDEYFSKIESQKLELSKKLQEDSVLKRLDKVKEDHVKRIQDLQKSEENAKYKAFLIEQNVEEIEQAITIIRSAVANSLNWNELNKIIKEEKKRGDPIASIIHKLKLETNEIVLLLTPKGLEEDEFNEITKPAETVDIDISLTAYANAARQYDLKKKAQTKAQKTMDAADTAIKAAEKKTKNALKEVQTKAKLQQMRKVLWFEKFNWFITSENYLVLCGKDAQQNEQLVKRYLKKNDIYVHADIHGAGSCVIKNPVTSSNTSEIPLPPPNTLLQAGIMSVCRSGAWNQKVITSAYWVYSEQVSKTAPSGEFLTTGSFMIRGKKNYLPPSPLIMGFGVLFKLHESSLQRHLGERSISLKASLDELAIDDNDDIPIPEDEDDIEDVDNSNNTSATTTTTSTTSTASSNPSGESNVLLKSSLRTLGFGVTYDSNDNNNNNNAEQSNESEDTNDKKRNKPRVSAKQKKQAKKKEAKSTTTESTSNNENATSTTKQETEEEEEAEEVEQTVEAKELDTSSSSDKVKVKQVPVPRGKKGKLKKMKTKYADQDEEERKIKLELLAVCRF